MNDLCFIIKGNSPTKKTASGPYKFVVTAAERRTADTYQFDTEAVCLPMVSSTGHGHAAIHRIHYEKGKFALANIMAALTAKPGQPLLTKYLYYYLWRFKEEKLVSLMAGTANTSLTIDKLKTVMISFPDIETQKIIVKTLDETIQCLIDLKTYIDKMNEIEQDALEKVLISTFSFS